jgi:GNAT superfamily N-acetyltransferase
MTLRTPIRGLQSVAVVVHVLPRPPASSDLDDLAQLLVDAVESGAGVSFMRPLSVDAARAWWRQTLECCDPRAVFLVARDDRGITGSVQLHPAWAPNQPHRADVAKLMVHRRARRRGVGRELVGAIEAHARQAGFSLLTLDTVRGDAAETLYAAAGWQRVGVIPDYALSPDGVLCDTVVFYKKV